MGKIARLVRHIVAFMRGFVARVCRHGWRSGWVFTVCWWTDFYTHQRNKRTRSAPAECPICGWTGYDFFTLDCGTFHVSHVACPRCGSHERHRLLHLYLTRDESRFLDASGLALHFAPEQQVRQLIDCNPKLKCISTDYAWHMVAAQNGPAFQSDMQCLPVQDGVIDVLFCLHVLEHVPNDREGISELHRVLKPDGIAYILVPFMMDWEETVEFGAPDPAMFGHVRGYAPGDFSQRLRGFQVEEIRPSVFLSSDELERHRIPADGQIIFRCVRC